MTSQRGDDSSVLRESGALHDVATCDANLQTDSNHCGSCGHVCGTTNATVGCALGKCVFLCATGYVHCGTDDSTGCATAPGADPHHCGSCDHDCLGATCNAGFCKATPLATAQNASAMIAVDGQNVFWTNQGSTAATMPILGDGAVLRANKIDGTSPMTLAPNQPGARGIFVDANQVYWANRTGGTVATTAKAGGGAVTPIAMGQDYPWDVAADDINYYWVNGSDDVPQPAGSLWLLPRAGGMAQPIRDVAVLSADVDPNQRVPLLA